MKLLNFELSEPSFAIHLIGLGFVWDLHNAAEFLGINMNLKDNTATMSWVVDGDPSTKYSGCHLIFKGLKLMIVSPRDEELPYSEDLCVSGISKIIPDHTKKSTHRAKRQWGANESFHLLFEFQSQRSIELNAETVELVGVSKDPKSA